MMYHACVNVLVHIIETCGLHPYMCLHVLMHM